VPARRTVAAIGIGLLAVTLVAMLLHAGPRRAGSDRTPNGAFVVILTAGQQACQAAELVPADTAALRLTIGTYGSPGPPVTASATDAAGRVVTSGRLAPGWREGVVSIPVRRVTAARAPARVCLTDAAPAGTPGRIAIAGVRGDPGFTILVAGTPEPGVRVRIDYMRPGRETWLQMLPTLAERLSLGKSGLVRHWAWVAVPLLMVLAIALALRVVLADGLPEREPRA
jgi:hypothetical protein